MDGWFIDKKIFNVYHNELYYISDKEWLDMPCVVFIDKECILLDHFKELKTRKIKAISFISKETLKDYKSRKNVTKKDAFNDGIFLLPNNWLFKFLMTKCN